MTARSFRPLLQWSYWAFFGVLVAVALAQQPMGWPRWVADLAVATAFTLSIPRVLHNLTAGWSAALIARLRHRHWWTGIYLAASIAIFAPLLAWPSAVPATFGAIALAGVTWLIVAGRPLLIPKDG